MLHSSIASQGGQSRCTFIRLAGMTVADSGQALVTASYGNRGLLDTGDGITERFVVKGRRLRVVCGDHVIWERQAPGNELLVSAVEDRRNQLERPDSRGKPELLAANLDCLLVVVAPQPAPDFFVSDRFLCAAELMDAKALVVWNKADLAEGIPAEVEEYAALGYPVIEASAETGAGIADLAAAITAGVNMFVGQSGVGKSSLLNCLTPTADAPTAEISAATGEGRHTTTASVMHTLANGARVVDTPGVREFAPFIRDPRSIQTGFREINREALSCRFADCQHLREPDCAVKRAVDSGKISERRYESYKRLCNTVRQLPRDTNG